mgnify:CR=1 FL=1
MTVVKPIHHTQEEPSRDKVLWEDRMFDKPRVYVEILLLLFSVFLLSFSGMGLLLIWHPLLYLSHSLVYHSIVFTEQKVVVKPAFLRRKRTFWYSELTLIEVQMIKRRQWKKRGWHSSLTLKIILTGFSGTKSPKFGLSKLDQNRSLGVSRLLWTVSAQSWGGSARARKDSRWNHSWGTYNASLLILISQANSLMTEKKNVGEKEEYPCFYGLCLSAYFYS